MPKLLGALCCCLRRSKDPHKKHETHSSGDYNDGRGGVGGVNGSSPITQITKGNSHQPKGGVTSHTVTTIKLVGDIRERLKPRHLQQQDVQKEQRRPPTQRSNNNNLTVVTIPTDQQKQLQQQRQFVHHHEQHQQSFLLPRVAPQDANKKCLIVDLDETLVHSSFKPVKNADFVIPVEIDNVVHQVYVLKRPHTDQFLERIGALFECVLFTASLAKYADPVADLLDKRRIFRARLFREACVFYEGNYVKDLERLGRDLRNVVIIDNSPASYSFHPDNAIPVRTWFDDPNDNELLDLLPLLEELAHANDIYAVLGTVPPSQQPRCLTPSEDMLLPPPMAPSSPITQVLPPSNNSLGQSSSSPWKKKENNTMLTIGVAAPDARRSLATRETLSTAQR